MATYTKDEIETAFEHYKAVSTECGRTGNWQPWGELFTEDATYVEHYYGEMHGRQAIVEWIQKTMDTAPNDSMHDFPYDWHIVDPDRGWVVFQAQNRMDDPGDGKVYEAASWTLLKYAGNSQWSYEEDMYNPNEFGEMISAWGKAKSAASAS